MQTEANISFTRNTGFLAASVIHSLRFFQILLLNLPEKNRRAFSKFR